jgi:hypothetical protein
MRTGPLGRFRTAAKPMRSQSMQMLCKCITILVIRVMCMVTA